MMISRSFLSVAPLLLLTIPSVSGAMFNTRGIPYPASRYSVFGMLDNATQVDVMDVLGYTNRTWNFLGTAAIELLSYEAIVNRSAGMEGNTTLPTMLNATSGNSRKTELDVLTDLGLNDEALYDCYIHHYFDYFWTELDEVEQQAFADLGWNVSSWDSLIPAPPSEDKFYAQLTVDEQQAAAELCYLPETWDGIGLQFWTIDYETLAYETLETATLSRLKSDAEDDFGMSEKEIEVEEGDSSALSWGNAHQYSAVLASVLLFVTF